MRRIFFLWENIFPLFPQQNEDPVCKRDIEKHRKVTKVTIIYFYLHSLCCFLRNLLY